MKNLRSKFVVTLLILSILIGTKERTVLAGTIDYRWKTSPPFTIYATNQLSQYELEQLQSAINIWNNTRLGKLFIYGGVKSYISKLGNDGISMVGKLSLASGENAKTNHVVNFNSFIIYEADIIINSNIEYNINSNYNLCSVLVHELEHFLCLTDNNNINSVMYKYYTGRTFPIESDITELEELYKK